MNREEYFKDCAQRLWHLLDTISTLDDACRSNDAAFRRLAMQRAEKRGQIAFSPDGHTLVWVGEPGAPIIERPQVIKPKVPSSPVVGDCKPELL